jgi:hypothetical protein
MIMQLRMPVDRIDTDQSVIVILDDGRRVHIHGSGEISVYTAEHRLGNEDYSLRLPSVEYVAANCDAKNATMGHGHVTITVEHRH